MAETTMDAFLGDNHDAILVAVAERMRGDEVMGDVATQRDLSQADMTSQVLGFWLQAIRTDLELGSTAALAQNFQWLARLRSGHDLPFDDAMVMRMFDEISAVIVARLDSEELRAEYDAYAGKVRVLVAETFPG